MTQPIHYNPPNAPFQPALAANSVAIIAAPPDQTSLTAPDPSADRIVASGGQYVLLTPIGKANNGTGKLQVYGWRQVTVPGSSEPEFWISLPIGNLDFTLGAGVGQAGHALIDETVVVADTIAIDVYQPVLAAVTWTGAAQGLADRGAAFLLPTIGYQFIEIDVFNVGSTECNCLVASI